MTCQKSHVPPMEDTPEGECNRKESHAIRKQRAIDELQSKIKNDSALQSKILIQHIKLKKLNVQEFNTYKKK